MLVYSAMQYSIHKCEVKLPYVWMLFIYLVNTLYISFLDEFDGN